MGTIDLLYSLFVPAACIAGIVLGGIAAGFSIRNILKKRYRLFSWFYIAVGGMIAFVLARMLQSALGGFVCSRGPAATVLIYAGIDALMALILVDTAIYGKRKGA